MNKEEIKKAIKKEINENLDKFVDELVKDLDGETFDLSKLENSIGDSINGYQDTLINTTERILNSKCCEDLVSKKKQNGKKKATD